MSTITCPECGKENDPESLFCRGCGIPLEQTELLEPQEDESLFCVYCGKPLEHDAIFCTGCGNNIVGTSMRRPDDTPVQPAALSGQPAAHQPSAAMGDFGMRAKESMTQEVGIPTWMAIAIVVVLVALSAIVALAVFGPNLFNEQPSSSSESPQQVQVIQQVESTPSGNNSASTSNSSGTSTSSSTSAATSSSSSSGSASSSASTSSTSTASSDDYILPDSATHKYTRSELQTMSTLDLYHARNEIYARHGRGFKNEDLQKYFGSKSWYRETIAPEDFNDSMLNEVERANANLMLEIEKSKGSPYLS